jgi:hypothetical protein
MLPDQRRQVASLFSSLIWMFAIVLLRCSI